MIIERYEHLKLKRSYRKTRLTIMADYCAEPLWLITKENVKFSVNTEIEDKDLPYNLRLLKRDFENWSREYDLLFDNEYIKYKYLIQTNKVKRFIQKGYNLSKKVRMLSPIMKINDVLFFDDTIMQRKLISKRDQHVEKFEE